MVEGGEENGGMGGGEEIVDEVNCGGVSGGAGCGMKHLEAYQHHWRQQKKMDG